MCLICSLVFDFFDGFTARALKAHSDLGLQLDSLADMVSFGVLPGLTMFIALTPYDHDLFGIDFIFPIKYFGLLVTLFSALRLAIFNLDTDQKYYFKGLNTPSNTILLFGSYYCFKDSNAFSFIFENGELLVLIAIVFSILLVSPVKMIALKFKSKNIRDNIPKIVLLIGCILLLIILKTPGIPICILYYILVSLFFQNKLA